jgi:DNA-binding phage protein
MSRYHQRRAMALQEPEVAAGYWEMDSEIRLMQALNVVRQQMHLSTTDLAARMGRHRETVSRLLNAQDANPTLDTISDFLKALHLHAHVSLRAAEEDEAPLSIAVDVESKQPA